VEWCKWKSRWSTAGLGKTGLKVKILLKGWCAKYLRYCAEISGKLCNWST
jgi:hypothetical protein